MEKTEHDKCSKFLAGRKSSYKEGWGHVSRGAAAPILFESAPTYFGNFCMEKSQGKLRERKGVKKVSSTQSFNYLTETLRKD